MRGTRCRVRDRVSWEEVRNCSRYATHDSQGGCCMSSLADALIVFGLVFVSGIVGLTLRSFLPDPHLHEDSLRMVRLCTGVIGTLAALVLGLLVASAKANYDRATDEVTHTAAVAVLLDRTLAQYGPQTNKARSILRTTITSALTTVFSKDGHGLAELDTRERLDMNESLQATVRNLIPDTDAQRMLQAHALAIANDIAQTRVLAFTQAQSSIPALLLVVLVLWLAIMFAGFGLVTSINPTVIVTLLLCAVSLASAVLMIEELSLPFEGFMRVSSAPLRYALAHLGQ